MDKEKTPTIEPQHPQDEHQQEENNDVKKKKKLHLGWWIGTTLLSIVAPIGAFISFFILAFAMVCQTLSEVLIFGAVFVTIVAFYFYFIVGLVPKGHRIKMFIYSIAVMIIGLVVSRGIPFLLSLLPL